jgi:hypothetical protein
MTCPTYSIRMCPWKTLPSSSSAHTRALAQATASTTARKNPASLILVFTPTSFRTGRRYIARTRGCHNGVRLKFGLTLTQDCLKRSKSLKTRCMGVLGV